MGIIIYIIFGALVGWAASEVMSTGGGLLWDIGVGIAGAFIGGLIMNFFGENGVGGFNFYSFIVALLGACVFIAIVRGVRK